MADGRCESCRHWQLNHGDDRTVGFGLCEAIKDAGQFAFAEGPRPKKEKVVLWAYDGAYLMTRPDFGCTLHKPKKGGTR